MSKKSTAGALPRKNVKFFAGTLGKNSTFFLRPTKKTAARRRQKGGLRIGRQQKSSSPSQDGLRKRATINYHSEHRCFAPKYPARAAGFPNHRAHPHRPAAYGAHQSHRLDLQW